MLKKPVLDLQFSEENEEFAAWVLDVCSIRLRLFILVAPAFAYAPAEFAAEAVDV